MEKNTDIIEDTLSEVWSKALSKMPPNRFNTWLLCLGTFLSALLGFLSIWTPNRLKHIQDFLDLYIQVSAVLLGFTIAGATIFISAYSPKFVLKMWRFKDEETGFSMYKAHLLNYVEVLVLCLINLVFGTISVGLSRFVNWSTIADQIESIYVVGTIQATYFLVLGILFSKMFISVKAMIYNFYNLTLTQLKAFDIEDQKANKEQ